MDNKRDGCPKCGSHKGFYANVRALKCYYTDGSEEKTFVTGRTVQTVRCFECGYKTTLNQLRERTKRT